MKVKSTLQQYGKDRGWFITCPKCDTKFPSNKKCVFQSNGMEYKDCPFCNEKPRFTTGKFKMLCRIYQPIHVADEYRDGTHWTVWGFADIKGEYHKRELK